MANWAADIRLGIPAIDEDHARIVMLINELDQAIAANRPRDEIAGVLNDILAASGEHFCREEQAMRRCRYARLAQHKHLHDDLVKALRLATAEVAADRRPADAALVDWLHGWFVDHVLEADRDFTRTLTEDTRLSA